MPHLHLESGAKVGRPELNGAHLPTGRIAIEDFLRILLNDFKIVPLREDWEEVIEQTQSAFSEY